MKALAKPARWLALAAVLACAGAAAACGDDGATPPEPDAAPPETTFTSYVLDLVLHQTAGNTDPRPFAEFSTLPDVDQTNEHAYEALFP